MRATPLRLFDPNETVFSAWPLPKRILRGAARCVCGFADTGLFGLTPLRKHIVICGYPRAGSTMLQLMLQHVYPHARKFDGEMPGYRAAMLAPRNHSLIVSKQQGDIFKLHRLRNHHARRFVEFRPIVTIRDPRDVLTSRHAGRPDREYFLEIEKWSSYDEYVRVYERSSAVLLLKYEDLVTDVDNAGRRLETFIGEPMSGSINSFQSSVPASFRDRAALNGLRAVESDGLGRWRDPRHAGRIRQILQVLPDFTQRLVELGYEPDRRWADDYLDKRPDSSPRSKSVAGASATPPRQRVGAMA